MAGQWPPQTPPNYPLGGPPPTPPSSGSRTVIVVLAVVGAILVLGLGGCVACGVVLGGAVNHGVKEVDKSLRAAQNRNSITDEQAAGVERGTRRERIVARFGPPATGAVDRPASGRDCIFYNVRGGTLGSQWEFCFSAGKLVTKRRA